MFIKEFDNLNECTCSTQTSCEEIINRGWIAKIPQLQSSNSDSTDNHFCTNNFYEKKANKLTKSFNFSFYNYLTDRKRRRIDHDESIIIIKLLRLCAICHLVPLEKPTKKNNETISNPKGFIDSSQAHDLLSCYM